MLIGGLQQHNVYPVGLWHRPRFKATETPQTPKPSLGTKLKKNFFWGTSLGAMIFNLAGGMTLLVSSLLPGNTPEKPISVNTPTVASAPTHTEMILDSSAKADLNAIKKLMKELGLLGVMTGVGFGCLSELGVGIKQKQPTLALSNLIFLGATPLFSGDSTLVRGLFLFLLGPFFAGYANVVRNKFEPNAPQEPREQAFQIKSMNDFTHISQYVLDDHLQLVSATKQSPALIKTILSDLRKTLVAIKNGEQVVITPSADRVRLSAVGHYAGGAILMLSGGNPYLATLGSSLATVSGLGASLEWFAIGTQRKDFIGKVLQIATPIQAMGKAFFHTNIGYAIEQLGTGSLYSLSLELNAEENKDVAPAAKTPHTPPLAGD